MSILAQHQERLGVKRIDPAKLKKPVAIWDITQRVDGGFEEFWGQPIAMPDTEEQVGEGKVTRYEVMERARSLAHYREIIRDLKEAATEPDNQEHPHGSLSFYRLPFPRVTAPAETDFDPFREEA